MKIIFLRSNPVDPDSRVEKEVNSLIKLGHEVSILAWDRSSKYKVRESYLEMRNGKTKIYRFGIPALFGGGIKSNLIPLMKFQYSLYSWLVKNRNKYDVIHACDFDTAYIGSKIAKRFNKRFVYDIFDYYVDSFSVPKLLRNRIENMDKKTINLADAVIICSDKRKEQISKTNPKLLEVIHNTPNIIEGESVYNNLNKNKIKIVYVGILGRGRYIEEIADFVIRNKEYEFHIGGFGLLQSKIEKLAAQYDNIIFYGKLSYERTLALESKCDIMTAIYNPAIPNHRFAAPNKFYEALMLGKPLIMVKNTGMDSIVEENKIGEVIEYNTDSFAAAIKRLVSNQSDWKNISYRMKELYKINYSWREMERRLTTLYEKLM